MGYLEPFTVNATLHSNWCASRLFRARTSVTAQRRDPAPVNLREMRERHSVADHP